MDKPTNKRYILFGGDPYGSGLGWDHFEGAFGSVEEAKKATKPHFYDWQIVDLQTLEVVWIDVYDPFKAAPPVTN